MTIRADELRDMLVDGGEIALLDAREEAEYGACHILLAVNVPLSRLELLVPRLVPRRGTRIVVCDGDDRGIARRAAERLEHFGYRDVSVLAGGTDAWQSAGFEVFSGVNVPSKLFGEFVEHHYRTPSIGAEELKSRMDSGEKLVVLDSRPLSEFEVMSIPGATCVPGAELVYRVRELAPDPDTVVVVNCAGRTRSIIGAQSLINAGIENEVVALRNGTMGWHLAGLALEHGERRYLPRVSAPNVADAKRRAAAVGERFGVRTIDQRTLSRWQREGDRTLYMLDVRSPEEYASGHVPGSVCAPGGQLVQATDRYVGTLRARLVILDDNGVRAAMTASWLEQLGLHEVWVLERGVLDSTLLRGSEPQTLLGIEELDAATIEPAELATRLAAERVAILDLQRSLEFRRGHIPGALHAVRGRLDGRIPALPDHDLLVLTCDDGVLARYAHEEAAQLTKSPVVALAGGNAAWRGEGRPMDEGDVGLEPNPVDAFLRAYDLDRGVEEAMQSYLDWEIALLERYAHDGTVRFKTA